MIKTRITELFGIEYPIMMGGLQALGVAELVAHVSNAGGLGFLSASTFDTTEKLVDEIKKTKSLTDKPFGVNVSMVPEATSGDRTLEVVEAIAREKVDVVETSGRNPKDIFPIFKQAGIKTVHKVAGLKNALSMERLGVDAVNVVCFEAAGHPGNDDLTTFVNIPYTARGLNIPVIASGGVADAAGLVAALCLGAEGVNMGTRFVATQECWAHPKAKEWIVNAKIEDTMIIQRSIRNGVRNIKNTNSYRVLGMEQAGKTLKDLMPYIAGARGVRAWTEGNMEDTPVSLGQNVGLINDIPTIPELFERMGKEAVELLQKMNRAFGI